MLLYLSSCVVPQPFFVRELRGENLTLRKYEMAFINSLEKAKYLVFQEYMPLSLRIDINMPDLLLQKFEIFGRK